VSDGTSVGVSVGSSVDDGAKDGVRLSEGEGVVDGIGVSLHASVSVSLGSSVGVISSVGVSERSSKSCLWNSGPLKALRFSNEPLKSAGMLRLPLAFRKLCGEKAATGALALASPWVGKMLVKTIAISANQLEKPLKMDVLPLFTLPQL
jgi:hypothetical protein